MNTFPDEIIIHILGYLKLRFSIRLKSTCRKFHDVIDEKFMKNVIREHYGMDGTSQDIKWFVCRQAMTIDYFLYEFGNGNFLIYDNNDYSHKIVDIRWNVISKLNLPTMYVYDLNFIRYVKSKEDTKTIITYDTTGKIISDESFTVNGKFAITTSGEHFHYNDIGICRSSTIKFSNGNYLLFDNLVELYDSNLSLIKIVNGYLNKVSLNILRDKVACISGDKFVIIDKDGNETSLEYVEAKAFYVLKNVVAFQTVSELNICDISTLKPIMIIKFNRLIRNVWNSQTEYGMDSPTRIIEYRKNEFIIGYKNGSVFHFALGKQPRLIKKFDHEITRLSVVCKIRIMCVTKNLNENVIHIIDIF